MGLFLILIFIIWVVAMVTILPKIIRIIFSVDKSLTNNTREKEIELKERELALKEKELSIKKMEN